MPRIVLVSNTAWSLYNFRQNIIRSLLASGAEIVAIAPADEFSPKLAALGCQVINLPMAAQGVNPLEDLGLFGRLVVLYRRLEPDFIFHYTVKPNIYGSLAARVAGVRSIAVPTGLGYAFVNENWVSRVARALYRLAFRFPEQVWFLNEDDRSEFVMCGLVRPDKAYVLPGEGIDTDHFAPLPSRIAVGEGCCRFLLVARMLWDKGVGEYVAAARQLKQRYPRAEFQLLGATGVSNPSVIGTEQIEAWVAEGVVEYLGTTTDVRPNIAAADCVVLPSYREGISRTLLEAAAMAKPIIASDVPGCRELVLPGVSGLLCVPRDASALADALEQIIRLPAAELQEMGLQGRQLVSASFSDQAVVAHYVAVLRRYAVLDC